MADALKQTLRAGALHLAGNAGIFGLESLADLLGQLEVDRSVPYDLALFFGRLDKRRRYRTGRWRGGKPSCFALEEEKGEGWKGSGAMGPAINEARPSL